LQKALKVLILGIGNPGRGDDGLGPALIERLQQNSPARSNLLNAERVCEFRYQLNVEDALTIKDYDAVVFTDATTTGDSPARLTEIGPADSIEVPEDAERIEAEGRVRGTFSRGRCHSLSRPIPRELG